MRWLRKGSKSKSTIRELNPSENERNREEMDRNGDSSGKGKKQAV